MERSGWKITTTGIRRDGMTRQNDLMMIMTERNKCTSIACYKGFWMSDLRFVTITLFLLPHFFSSFTCMRNEIRCILDGLGWTTIMYQIINECYDLLSLDPSLQKFLPGPLYLLAVAVEACGGFCRARERLASYSEYLNLPGNYRTAMC
jgi:hypothetical protein